MGYIHGNYGLITIETLSESFIIHAGYGDKQAIDDVDSVDPLGLGKLWQYYPHPEFANSDLADLIAALMAVLCAKT